MSWISSEQQARDHKGLRNICGACGHPGTAKNQLGLSNCGSRIHMSHFNDPNDGFYGQRQ